MLYLLRWTPIQTETLGTSDVILSLSHDFYKSKLKCFHHIVVNLQFADVGT